MRVILPGGSHLPERAVPAPTLKERVGFAAGVFVKGASAFGGKLAALTGLVGGSVLTYGLFVANLSVPWALVVALVVVVGVVLVGAYQVWREAFDLAWRFCPTWEQLQERADILRAVVDQPSDDAAFRGTYMAGHMAVTRRDYDRAAAAGYQADFDRDRIGTAGRADVRALVSAFDEVVQRWRNAEGT